MGTCSSKSSDPNPVAGSLPRRITAVAAALACALFLVWQWKLDHAFTRRWTQSLPLLIGFLPAWLGACIGGWRSRWISGWLAVGALTILFTLVVVVKLRNNEDLYATLQSVAFGLTGFCLWCVWTWAATRSHTSRMTLRCTAALFLVSSTGRSLAKWVGFPIIGDQFGFIPYVHLDGQLWGYAEPVPVLYTDYGRQATWSKDGYGRALLQRCYFGSDGWKGFQRNADSISIEQIPADFFRKRLPLWWPNKPEPHFRYFEGHSFFKNRSPGTLAKAARKADSHFIIEDPLRGIIYIWVEIP